MDKIYNKLVRDNIPEIIEKDGEIPFTRILNDDEYKIELFKKLEEECKEVIGAETKDDIIGELADVLEVLKSIAELNELSLQEVIEKAEEKRLVRGGFSKKIYLEKTTKKEVI